MALLKKQRSAMLGFVTFKFLPLWVTTLLAKTGLVHLYTSKSACISPQWCCQLLWDSCMGAPAECVSPLQVSLSTRKRRSRRSLTASRTTRQD